MQAGALNLVANAACQKDVEGENLVDDLSPPRLTRKSHNRCKKKERSMQEQRMRVVRTYMASLGISWPEFQKIHSRLQWQRTLGYSIDLYSDIYIYILIYIDL